MTEDPGLTAATPSSEDGESSWEDSLESGPKRINTLRDSLQGAIDNNAFTKKQFTLLDQAIKLLDKVTGRDKR